MPKYQWEEMQLLLDDITNLPTLPTVMINAINIAFDPTSDINDLYKLLRNDPSITAQILRVVNSSFYGTSKKVESLKTAMVVLGMDEVVSIVTAVSMAETFKDVDAKASFDLRRFWLHCVAVGEIAESLVPKSKDHTQGEMFTAGLLHDIGSILLATYFPDDFALAYEAAKAKNLPLHKAEQEVLGFDHARVGDYLASRWNLPESLVTVIRHHHEPTLLDPLTPDVAVVYIADRLCNTGEVGIEEWAEDAPFEDDPNWEAALTVWSKGGHVDLKKLAETVQQNIERARDFVQLMMF